MRAWHDAGGPKIRVSVNLSTQQFHLSNLCETIRGILEETGLPPEYLELEITESMMMDVTRSTKFCRS
nr:EAL domain-containing protein [Paenibacillus dendritiformis]